MLLLLLVFAAVVPFVYPLNNGKPLLSLELLRLPSLPEVALPVPGIAADSGKVVTAYKWQDKVGNWHFGSEPPLGLSHETIELDPNANLLQGIESAAQRSPVDEPSSVQPGQVGEGDIPFGDTPEQIGAMMDKARQAREALQAHNRTMEGLDK